MEFNHIHMRERNGLQSNREGQARYEVQKMRSNVEDYIKKNIYEYVYRIYTHRECRAV